MAFCVNTYFSFIDWTKLVHQLETEGLKFKFENKFINHNSNCFKFNINLNNNCAAQKKTTISHRILMELVDFLSDRKFQIITDDREPDHLTPMNGWMYTAHVLATRANLVTWAHNKPTTIAANR